MSRFRTLFSLVSPRKFTSSDSAALHAPGRRTACPASVIRAASRGICSLNHLKLLCSRIFLSLMRVCRWTGSRDRMAAASASARASILPSGGVDRSTPENAAAALARQVASPSAELAAPADDDATDATTTSSSGGAVCARDRGAGFGGRAATTRRNSPGCSPRPPAGRLRWCLFCTRISPPTLTNRVVSTTEHPCCPHGSQQTLPQSYCISQRPVVSVSHIG